MLIFRNPGQLSLIRKPIVLAAGAFDGVHRGHQAVIRGAIRAARALKGEAWVMTFDPHPLRILRPDLAPALLTSQDHKMRLLRELGINGCLVLPFTKKLARVEPEDFVAGLKRGAPTLSQMVVGKNWTFGRRARGNVSMLRKLAKSLSFRVTTARHRMSMREPISSTRIRDAVARGRLEDAARMLGRPFSIRGDVVHGKKLGRKLGFPTANVDPHNEVRPPAGIYAARAVVLGQSYPAAVYLDDKSKIVEVHLIDRRMQIYGQEIDIIFVRRIRAARRFASLVALKKKINSDVDAARRILRQRPAALSRA